MARLVVRTKAVNVSIGMGIRRELRAGDAALGLHTVTLPAAVLDIGRLALLGRGGERAATTECEAGGERRRPKTTNQTHRQASLARLGPDIDQRGLAGFHHR